MAEGEKTDCGRAFWTAEEIACVLRVRVATIRRMLVSGKMPGVRLGRDWRVAAGDFAAWARAKRCGKVEGGCRRSEEDATPIPAMRKQVVKVVRAAKPVE